MKIKTFIMGTLLATSCLFAPLSAGAYEKTDKGNYIVYGARQAVPVLDPHARYDWSTRMFQQAVYDGLVKYIGSEVEPWLATSWEANEEGTQWTFHLVQNAKFHNGDPVNAEAVRYSFERALRLNKGVAWMLKDFLKPEGISVVDEYTVRFDLHKPYGAFLSVLPWWFIVNPEQVKANEVDGDYGEKWMTDHDAGSGPFRLGRIEPNVLYMLDAVEDYWKGWPHDDKRPAGVVLRIMREPAAQRAALIKGEIDVAEGLSSDDYVQIKDTPGVVIERHPGMGKMGLVFNTQRGPTADKNLRKAIAYAIDYEAMREVYNGDAAPLDSIMTPFFKGHISVEDMPTRDLAKAKEYLAKSAYPEGGITLDYIHVAGFEEMRRAGLLLLDNLRELNININIKPEQWPNMVEAGSKVETSPNITSVLTTGVYLDPDAVAYQYHKNSHGQYYAMSHYTNEEVWEKIEQARSILDWEKRAPLYADIQRQIVDDLPEVFVMVPARLFARRDHLEGFVYSPVRFSGEFDLHHLWIDEK